MRSLIAIVGVLLLCTVVRAAEEGPRVFRCDPQSLATSRQRIKAGDPVLQSAMDALLKQADRYLRDGPFAVTEKMHPAPSNDPHDYVSLAPYFWPNPDTADHLPYVRHDGRRNPEIHDYDASRFGAMSGHAYALALAWYIGGDEKYAGHAALLLRTWFLDDATRMNPNLNYAQLVKGVNTGRGTGIIESARLLDVIDAVGLLHGSKSWTDSDQHGIEEWFRQYLSWLRSSKNGKAEAAATNNHGTWYDLQVVTFALFLSEKDLARDVLEGAKAGRIAKQVEPDGSQPRELTRTNSFGYSLFNLQAMTQLADLGDRTGVDLWHYRTADGRCIRASLDFLVPYATGEKKWTHEQISSMNATGMAVPLRRAARAYHEPHYEQIITNLKGDQPVGIVLLQFPPALRQGN